jgi:hypothetical protein
VQLVDDKGAAAFGAEGRSSRTFTIAKTSPMPSYKGTLSADEMADLSWIPDVPERAVAMTTRRRLSACSVAGLIVCCRCRCRVR